MWNLIRNLNTQQVTSLFETDDKADVGTNDILEQFPSRSDAISRILELGLTYVPDRIDKISKLTIRRRLREMKLEDVFNKLLAQYPEAQADWDDAGTIDTDDPVFQQAVLAIQKEAGLDDATMDAILSPENQIL
jgi:hypothetical protein